jgi:hypothetical protein
MKGEELAKAVRDLDRVREEESSISHHQSTTSLAMPIPVSSSSFHNPFGLGGFGYNGLPPSAYNRRPSSVPLPLTNNNTDLLFPFGDYSHHHQTLDISSITLPSVPFMPQTRPTSPINNISRQHQRTTLLGQRRASSAQPVFRRSWTLPINPSFTNTDFSGFDWIPQPQQVQRDESPLPDVDPELFNGFSFDEGHAADNNATLFSSNTLSTTSTSSASSDRNPSPPWLDNTATTPHSHSRSHSQHLAIAPHDLPPLHVSDNMNWHGASNSLPQSSSSLLSATSSSSSSTFPSPSLLSSTPPTSDAKQDLGMTPTNEMFELSLGYDMGLGGVDYAYNGYNNNNNDMGFGGGDLGLEMGGYAAAPQEMAMGMGMDAMWNVVVGQQA